MANIISQINVSLKTIKDTVIRERLLLVRASQKQPLREVAKTFSCTHGKVDYWKKRYESLGLRGLQTKSRSGRPKKISQEQEKKIRRKVRKHNPAQGWQTKHIKELIKEETGVKYTERHTLRIAQSWGLSQITPRPRNIRSKREDREEFLKKK